MATKPKTFCGDLTQPLKCFVINCGTSNLDTENPDEISDGLICIALFLQKRMKHLQIVVNGLIPHDAINTKQRQTLLEVNQLLQDKSTNYNKFYFLKPDTEWRKLNGGLSKTYYYKENLLLLENGNKNLVLSIKAKPDNKSVICHEITINEEEVPALKTYDPTIKAVDRPDYRRAITTSSINWQ